MGTGIDLGTCAVKMVELKPSGKGFALLSAGRRRREERENGDPFVATSSALSSLRGVVQGKAGSVVGFSSRDINLQFIQLPPVKNHVIRTMMKYEIVQRVGSAIDVYAEYCILHKPNSAANHHDVVLGQAKKLFIDGTMNAVRMAGVKGLDALPNAHALFTAFANSRHPREGTTILVDIGYEHIELVFVREGRMIFARTVTPAFKNCIEAVKRSFGNISDVYAERLVIKKTHFGAAEKPSEVSEKVTGAVRGALGQISSVIHSTISFAKIQLKDQKLKPDRILLSGGGAKLEGIARYLTTSLDTPVENFNPFAAVDLSRLPPNHAEKITELPTDMANALGLAEIATDGIDGATLSFLPEREKKKRKFRRQTLPLSAAAIIVLFTMMMLTISSSTALSSATAALDAKRRESAAVMTNIDKFEKAIAEQKENERAFDRMRDRTRESQVILDALSKLTKTLPEQAWIGDIRIDHDDANPISVGGLVSENIEGGPDAFLDRLEQQLTDFSRRIKAEITDVKTPEDRKGWRSFTVTLKTNSE